LSANTLTGADGLAACCATIGAGFDSAEVTRGGASGAALPARAAGLP